MYRILVCDDEKDIVDALKIYLSGGEYQVFTAYTGQEAVELACDLWDLDPEEILDENQESGMKMT